MENMSLEAVDIFDDFEEPGTMVKAYCTQVTADQYQEDTSSETDIAIGELCMFLEKNPDVYARVLRKRKQEEMESAGVFSFVKSKMMSLLHGEQYPHCLVNASECIQKTNALKSGMCKTFHLSQELKGDVIRQSSRLAAKRQAKPSCIGSNVDQPLVLNGKRPRDKSSIVSDRPDPSRDTTTKPKVDKSPNLLGPVVDLNSSMDTDGIISGRNGSHVLTFASEKVNGAGATKVPAAQPALLEVSSCVVIPAPPPAPPLPPSFISSSFPKNIIQGAHHVCKNSHSLKPATPNNLKQQQRSSPRLRVSLSVDRKPTKTNSLHDLSELSHSDTSSVSSPFLTPELPTRYRTHKRSQSNSSVSSVSSSGSFSSINSEIMSMNPITRLKATHINRSPGGTPARLKSDALPSEPFHKALYTALKSRFKNVTSPRSGNSTVNASNNSTLNTTFSP